MKFSVMFKNWNVNRWVESLPRKHEALYLITSTGKKITPHTIFNIYYNYIYKLYTHIQFQKSLKDEFKKIFPRIY